MVFDLIFSYVLKSIIPAIIVGLLGLYTKSLINKYPKILILILIYVVLFIAIILPISFIFKYYMSPLSGIFYPENLKINNSKIIINKSSSKWEVEPNILYSFGISLYKTRNNIPRILEIKIYFDNDNEIHYYINNTERIKETDIEEKAVSIIIDNSQIKDMIIFNNVNSDVFPFKFFCLNKSNISKISILTDFQKEYNYFFIAIFSLPIIMIYIIICIILFVFYKRISMKKESGEEDKED